MLVNLRRGNRDLASIAIDQEAEQTVNTRLTRLEVPAIKPSQSTGAPTSLVTLFGADDIREPRFDYLRET